MLMTTLMAAAHLMHFANHERSAFATKGKKPCSRCLRVGLLKTANTESYSCLLAIFCCL